MAVTVKKHYVDCRGKTEHRAAYHPYLSLRRIEEAYELFEGKRDGVIKVAVEC
mgnify:CR=1 FL=1